MERPLIHWKELQTHQLTASKLRWALKKNQAHKVAKAVYVLGSQPPTELELAAGRALSAGSVIMGELAAHIYGLETRRVLNIATIAARAHHDQGRRVNLRKADICEFNGILIASPERTLIELAGRHHDFTVEQMLESALHKRLTTTKKLLARVNTARHHGNKRIRRVLDGRGMDTPPTESLLETLTVQLLRRDPRIPTPTRQLELRTPMGELLGRVDFAFPKYRVFLEVDGAWHKGQVSYDNYRQTRISAYTGWVPLRFTWDDITRKPNHTLRLLWSVLAKQRSTLKNGAGMS